jgi:hypothetical protein
MVSLKRNFKIELAKNRKMWRVWITKYRGFINHAQGENNYPYLAGEFKKENDARKLFKRAREHPEQYWD